jgi:histidinol phosphatase-like PHP family hydrolase
VEITHVPKEDIDLVARAAKDLGARLVTVHGETIVEPVEPGTNDAAVRSASVDILAHPGLISYDDARLAAERGVYLEMSARKGHSLTNGHVAKVAKQAGAAMVLDSDAHEPDDLLTPELTRSIAMGAGLTDEEAHALLQLNPRNLLAKLGFGPAPASETGAISP